MRPSSVTNVLVTDKLYYFALHVSDLMIIKKKYVICWH